MSSIEFLTQDPGEKLDVLPQILYGRSALGA